MAVLGFWALSAVLFSTAATRVTHSSSLGLDQVTTEKTVKVRLFWIRHGLSCANIMDRCAVKPPESNQLIEEVQAGLASFPPFSNASLNKAFGVAAATTIEKDCTVEIEGAGLRPGQMGEQGAIVRVHDLYRDPALTDCSRLQSAEAGKAFLRWLRQKKAKLDFVGSSFLMRAFETATAMFVEACDGEGAENCAEVLDSKMKVTPVPYMTERAPQGLTAAQADNTPREVEDQSRMIQEVYQRELPVETTYVRTWPRYAQQWEKFKAFLAAELMPALRPDLGLGMTGGSGLKEAIEAALPQTMRHEEHGESPIFISWGNGTYATGEPFSTQEYRALDAPEVNLAVVGHSQMMLEYCQWGEPPKPNNNAVLEKLFILKASSAAIGPRHITFRELEGKCSKVMDAPNGKDSLASLVEADVATCSTPFVASKFLGLPAGGPLEETQCVKLAKPEAFPINKYFLD